MKKIYKKSVYKGLLSLFLLMTTQMALSKSLTFSEEFEWTYNIEPGATIELSNYDCDIIIEPSNSNTVRFVITVEAQAKEQADLDALKNYLENLTFPSRSNEVKLETTFWDNRSSSSFLGKNVIKMKLKNGRSVNLSEFNISARLYLPETSNFELESKYSKIEMSNVANLELNSYDDKIYGKNASGEVQINAKYSNLEFENFGPTEMDIYDSDFTAEKTEDLKIVSKYSKINIDQTGKIDMDGYDDTMTFNTIGDLDLNAKYSDLKCTKSGDLDLIIYDSNLEIDKIGNMNISESKYSSYEFETAGIVKISSSHDDEFNFGSILSFKANSSKYSEYVVSNLTNDYTILDSYDDNITIYETSPSFTYFDVNSKYAKIVLNTSAINNLKLDLDAKYGKLEFQESEFKTKIMIKDNSEYQYVGIKGTESENMPFIKIRGYDVKMNISN